MEKTIISVSGLPQDVWGVAEMKLGKTVRLYANKEPFAFKFSNGEALSVSITNMGSKALIARTRLEQMLLEEATRMRKKIIQGGA